MATDKLKAVLERGDDKVIIKIENVGGDIRIPLSEEKPNDVKLAFNKLINRMQDGFFEIDFQDDGGDLFFHVADEYLRQLNREIHEVYGEMQKFGLAD